MDNEINLPPRIAAAVIDAIEWMVSEGQFFADEAAGSELLEYLRDTYPEKYPEWFASL